MAPEVLTRRQYGKACDVWGAGVMLHVLLSGRLPFNGSGRRLQEAIARGRVPVSQNLQSKSQKNFVVKSKLFCFDFNLNHWGLRYIEFIASSKSICLDFK